MLLLVALVAASVAGPAESIPGTWQCEPYEIVKAEVSTTVVQSIEYRTDGTYGSTDVAEFSVGEDTLVLTARFHGRWEVQGDVLRVKTEGVEITHIAPPIVEPRAAEAVMMQGVSSRDWSEYRIVDSGARLVTERINPPEWLVKPTFSCSRCQAVRQ